MDWNKLRAEFSALSRWTYLNTATFGQMPKCGYDATSCHWAHRDETACHDFLSWYDDAGRLRASLARLINAASQDIAFTPSAAHALSTVVAGLKLGPSDSIVTLKDEFPNQLYQPQLREVEWEQFYKSIDSSVKLVALSEVNYASGFRPPLQEVSAFLKARGVPLFVDGTQSLGALQFDVQKTPVDVYAVHAYKWMISPPGAGFFYISPEFRARIPPAIVGWRSHKDWRNVDNLHHGSPEFSETAEKYEGGGLPAALLYAFEASVDLILRTGPCAIEARVLDLTRQTRELLCLLGAEVADTGSQIAAAKFPQKDPSALARGLKDRKIVVAARHGYLRVSPHFYNNAEDLEALGSALRELLAR
jgi:selenocysteine lyase/cysteine desulfurase